MDLKCTENIYKPFFTSLQEYIDNPYNTSPLLIDGNWGCGKTTFIKAFLEFYKPTCSFSRLLSFFSKPQPSSIYISLLNLQSIDELYEKLIGEILKNTKWLFSNNDVSFLKIMKKNISLVNLNKNTSSYYYLTNLLIKKVNLIVFDDLERSIIPPQIFLNFVADLNEFHNQKIILVANNKKYKINSIEGFEKLVGSTLKFTIDPDNIYRYLIRHLSLENQKLLTKTKPAFLSELAKNNCSNLRVIKYAHDIFLKLYSSLIKDLSTNKDINMEDLLSKIAVYTMNRSIQYRDGAIPPNNLIENRVGFTSRTLQKEPSSSSQELDDKSLNSPSDFIIGFDFVDIFILKGILTNEKKIIKSIKDYCLINTFNKLINTIINWPQLEDKELISSLHDLNNLLKKNLSIINDNIIKDIILCLSNLAHANIDCFKKDSISVLETLSPKIKENIIQNPSLKFEYIPSVYKSSNPIIEKLNTIFRDVTPYPYQNFNNWVQENKSLFLSKNKLLSLLPGTLSFEDILAPTNDALYHNIQLITSIYREIINANKIDEEEIKKIKNFLSCIEESKKENVGCIRLYDLDLLEKFLNNLLGNNNKTD